MRTFLLSAALVCGVCPQLLADDRPPLVVGKADPRYGVACTSVEDVRAFLKLLHTADGKLPIPIFFARVASSGIGCQMGSGLLTYEGIESRISIAGKTYEVTHFTVEGNDLFSYRQFDPGI